MVENQNIPKIWGDYRMSKTDMLTKAKVKKNDKFYTIYEDIENLFK